MAIRKIAVLGAGNGGCAAAADLTLRGYEVRLFSRSDATLLPIIKQGGITLSEAGEEKFAAPYFHSPHIIPVIEGVDLILSQRRRLRMNIWRKAWRRIYRTANAFC